MKTERVPWHLLVALALGLGLGLLISWVIAPTAYTDTPPSQLRSDFKDGYRSIIAAAYASTGDLERAKERLSTLNDADTIIALESQAQRTLAEEDAPESFDALAALAADLAHEISATQVTATSTKFLTQTPRVSLPTGTVATPTEDNSTPEPASATLTPIPFNTRTPRATREASPTPRAPFILQTQDAICSTNISEGLLMVFVSTSSQKALPGVEIIVSWNGNEEHFFTGVKPELGNGYADFAMVPNQNYSLRLATGSTAVSGLSIPSCENEDGNQYWGSLRLKFEQP